jgi:hypothetical protein
MLLALMLTPVAVATLALLVTERGRLAVRR